MKKSKALVLAAAIAASTLLVSTVPANAAGVDIRVGTVQPMSGAGFAVLDMGRNRHEGPGAALAVDPEIVGIYFGKRNKS